MKIKIAIILIVIFAVVASFSFFGEREDFTLHREVLQQVVNNYIAETGCYPSSRTVWFGNPSPIDFQKLYSELPEDFEIREDLYYFISSDGKVWLSKNDIPNIKKENNILSYNKDKKPTYLLYYYENDELMSTETESDTIDVSETNYAISLAYEKGLQTPPANEEYKGYEKHKPIIAIKTPEEALTLSSIIEEDSTDKNFFQRVFATITSVFTGPDNWENVYGVDIYGEKIVGEYNEDLNRVRVITKDGRESYWIDLDNPRETGNCLAITEEVEEVAQIGPTLEQPTAPVTESRNITITEGPKDNPNQFLSSISYTTYDNFSGTLYKMGDAFIEDKKTISEHVFRNDEEFLEAIEYNKDGFSGTLILTSVITDGRKITETKTETDPTLLPEKIEYSKPAYNGVLLPVGDYQEDRRSRSSSTSNKDVTKTVKKEDNDFSSTINYSEGGYSGSLSAVGSPKEITTDNGSKTITKTISRDDREFPDYVIYDEDGHNEKLYKDGGYRAIDSINKNVEEIIQRNDRKFPDYVDYDKDGYSGKLIKDGEYTKETTSTSGGTSTKTVTETLQRDDDSFPSYIEYDKNGYSGKLSPTGDCWTDGSVDRKNVTETITRDNAKDLLDYVDYDKDGYSGRLERDGGYIKETIDTKTVTETITQTERSFEDEIDYSEAGYEGTLDKDGSYIRDGENFSQNYTGEVVKESYTQDYSGEVETTGSEIYFRDYSGDVSKTTSGTSTTTYYQTYSGDVLKEDSFEQDYSGEIDGVKTTTFEQIYSGTASKRVSRGSYKVYTQTYEGLIHILEEAMYVGVYEGVVKSDGYYQLYTGIVNK